MSHLRLTGEVNNGQHPEAKKLTLIYGYSHYRSTLFKVFEVTWGENLKYYKIFN